MRNYLGEHADAFQQTIAEVNEILEKVARNIEGFVEVAVDMSSRDLLKAVSMTTTEAIKVKFFNGFKLSLHKSDIEGYIKSLQAATDIISKIQVSTVTLNNIAAKGSNTIGKKLTKSLVRIGEYANRLHAALSSVWIEGCHPSHETRLYLEDRIDEATGKKISKPLHFNMLVSWQSEHLNSKIWHESIVEIASDGFPEDDHPALTSQRSQVKVKFSDANSNRPAAPTRIEVKGLCTEIGRAYKGQRQLRLLLYNSCRFCFHETPGAALAACPPEMITLHELLRPSLNSRTAFSIRASLKLALIIASALLQLHTTPWFNNFWSKNGVYFIRQATPSGGINITQPLIFRNFNHIATTPSPVANTEPREVLLEFGILLLEIWRLVPFEEKFADRANQLHGDYIDRMSLAWRWLLESEQHLLEYQCRAISYCIKPVFGDSLEMKPT